MQRIDLSGQWELHRGLRTERQEIYEDKIQLPDSLSHAKKGEWQSIRQSDYLTDPYAWEGCAWFRREIEFRNKWKGQDVFLILERTRLSTVYLDKHEIGSQQSLCTPHRYLLPTSDSGSHILEIAISNINYPTKGGHMTSPDTQTNWNGILGKICLEICPRQRVENIQVMSSTRTNRVCFSLESTAKGFISYCVDDGKETKAAVAKGQHEFEYLPEAPLEPWDEFSPIIHTLRVSMNGDSVQIPFGVRILETQGRKLFINGRETFLRGKHHAMVFPETGYAPMTTEAWLRDMSIAKDYGINHYRFHTCCPPEAAFTIADQLGIYLEPELPFWGTVEETLTEEQQYLIDEGFRILREYGNHPSFVLFSLGNELWGSQQRMEDMLEGYRKIDDRHLYTDGSNNFQFTPRVLKNADFLCGVRLSTNRLYRGSYAMCDAPQGFIQTDQPNTLHDYDRIITVQGNPAANQEKIVQIQCGTGMKEVETAEVIESVPGVPVISHEIGQYEMYPDYSEINRYTGVLKAENLALYREKAKQKGLLPFADRFFRASGALALDCYRREIETALKSKELTGFQLLDLQDFPGQGTALVGILNAFMESKGLVSPEEWRSFCGATVIMARLPRFVFQEGENISAEILLFQTDPHFTGVKAKYRIIYQEKVLHEGRLSIRSDARLNSLGVIEWKPEKVTVPMVCYLELQVIGTEIRNQYRLTIYPTDELEITEYHIADDKREILIARSFAEAKKIREKNKAVILVPEAKGKLSGTYCTDFWCYPMFRSISEKMGKPIPAGTLGCLINSGHPILRGFPTETFSTPEWYRIIAHSHCENLDGTSIQPIIWVIDHPARAQRLGMLYIENSATGDILVCTSRLWEIAEAPEVKAFARSIMVWMRGDD